MEHGPPSRVSLLSVRVKVNRKSTQTLRVPEAVTPARWAPNGQEVLRIYSFQVVTRIYVAYVYYANGYSCEMSYVVVKPPL